MTSLCTKMAQQDSNKKYLFPPLNILCWIRRNSSFCLQTDQNQLFDPQSGISYIECLEILMALASAMSEQWEWENILVFCILEWYGMSDRDRDSSLIYVE